MFIVSSLLPLPQADSFALTGYRGLTGCREQPTVSCRLSCLTGYREAVLTKKRNVYDPNQRQKKRNVYGPNQRQKPFIYGPNQRQKQMFTVRRWNLTDMDWRERER